MEVCELNVYGDTMHPWCSRHFVLILVFSTHIGIALSSQINSTSPSSDGVTDTPVDGEWTTTSSYVDQTLEQTAFTSEPSNNGRIRKSDINSFIENDMVTQQYLATFKNSLQRYMVETQLTYCPYVALCGHKLNGNFDTYYTDNTNGEILYFTSNDSCCAPCSCDITTCKKKKLCCPDIIDEDELINNVDHENEHCISTKYSFNPHDPKYSGFIGIDTCNNSSYGPPEDLIYNCTRTYNYMANYSSMFEIIPCSSRHTNRFYRNKYCALCHGEFENDLDFFRLKVDNRDGPQGSFTESEILASQSTGNSLLVTFIPTDKQQDMVTKCTITVVQCSEEHIDTEEYKACGLYTSTLLSYSSYSFRNVFCALCYTPNGISGHDPYIHCPILVNFDINYLLGFSGLLRYSSIQTVDEGRNDKCTGDNQHFDSYQVSPC